MVHSQVLVLSNRQIAADYFEMTFAWPERADAPRPGQFFTVRAAPSPIPLLRRPFAISRYYAGNREAGTIYQKRGSATTAMASLHGGDRVDILAPLGNWFPEPDSSRTPLLVAGGIGMGPIFYFAEALRSNGVHRMELVLGARTRALLPEMELFSTVHTTLCTDDGSKGFHGTVLDFLREHSGDDAEIFACGPDPMLNALHHLADDRGIPCWVSMEQTMGCAVGACMGCAIRVPDDRHYVRVCTEGPVFRSRELSWE